MGFAAQFGVKGYREVVLSVSDLDRSASFDSEVGGYEVLYKGTCDIQQNLFWNIAETTQIDEMLLGNPGEAYPLLRLLNFHGAAQESVRAGLEHWDLGGIFDFDVGVLGLEAKRNACLARGLPLPQQDRKLGGRRLRHRPEVVLEGFIAPARPVGDAVQPR